MKAAVLTIGDELLQGFTVDSNSAWIAQELLPYQVQITYKITIGDDLAMILESMKMLLKGDFNFIFVTGGLGPTHDDITKTAFQQLFDTEEYFDTQYFEDLRKRFAARGYGDIPESNKSQAMMLSGCDHIPNPRGTALGMHFHKNDKHIFIMPGVPIEMKGIIQNTVIPDYLPVKAKSEIISLNTTNIPESKLYGDISDILDSYKSDFGVAFLPHHTGVNIRIRKLPDGQLPLSEMADAIKTRLGSAIYGKDEESLLDATTKLLISKQQTIAVAESCTGGLIGKWLTDQPGSSDYFLGGVIAYSNELKEKLLQVSPQLLETHGAVSSETAMAMAENVRRITGSDIGISATGISGPTGGTQEKPVGLVYIGLSMEQASFAKKFNFNKNRYLHRETTAQAALNLIRLQLVE